MPGVPSGKGCNACKRQKKKCDQQKPACSRCARLQITCTGSGQQRYKFKHVQVPVSDKDDQRRSQILSSRPTAPAPWRPPSNESTSTLHEFIWRLETIELQYDLCWGYGLFMREIPKRLGTSAALTAAASALTATSSYIFTGQRSQIIPALTRYGHALKALRACVDDPATARSSNTLCAILLIWFCHSCIGTDSDLSLKHGRAMVQILATAALSHPRDEFEHHLLLAVGASVLLESLCYSNTQLNPWMKKFLLENDKPVIAVDSNENLLPSAATSQNPHIPRSRPGLILTPLILLPDFIHFNPSLLPSIHSTHSSTLVTCQKIRECLQSLSSIPPSNSPPNPAFPVLPHLHLHAYYHRCYSLALYFAIMLNGILRAYDPELLNPTLEDEAAYLAQEVIELDQQSIPYRPLGATVVPLCLIAAWAAIKDKGRRVLFEETFGKYWEGVTGRSLVVTAGRIEEMLDELRANVIRARQSYVGEADDSWQVWGGNVDP